MARPEPFQIQISDAVLDDMYARLRHTRYADDYANDDWEYGFNGAYLRELINYWCNNFDWRAQERAMNELSQFRMDWQGLPLHFIHQRGKGPCHRRAGRAC